MDEKYIERMRSLLEDIAVSNKKCKPENHKIDNSHVTCDESTRIRSKYEKRKNRKIRSYSLSNEEGNTMFVPSTSELQVIKERKSKKKKRKTERCSINTSQSEAFDFNSFFETRSVENESALFPSLASVTSEFTEELLIDNHCSDCEDSFNESGSRIGENTFNRNSEEANKEENTILDNEDRLSQIISSDDSSHQMITEMKFPRADYYNLPNGKLIVLNSECTVPLHGFTSLKVLKGTLRLLGYELNENSDEISLYSPRGSALLCLNNSDVCSKGQITDLTDLLPDLKEYTDFNNITVRTDSIIVLCTKLRDHTISFIEKYISQKIFPQIDDSAMPQCLFNSPGSWNIIISHPDWDGIVGDVGNSTKLFLAGGKGVGKSTLLRYVINKLLMRFKEVRVIDLDPGQCEFTVPGSISVVTIDKPVFGPNYTHLKPTDRSILCNINVGHEPFKYIKSVEELINFFNTLPEVPTVINYMGFTHGIGLSIISAILYKVQPTTLVQIVSCSETKNFKIPLTPENVKEKAKIFLDDCDNDLVYKVIDLPSMTDLNDGWTLEPRQMREMCVLSYFGHLMNSKANSLTSCEIPLYEVDLNTIKAANLNGEEVPWMAINGTMVALCSFENDQHSLFNCYGWGVVRGIDLENAKLILITPENKTTLSNVFYLVISNVSLPPAVYMDPEVVNGQVPYVMNGELISLGQLTKRIYIPPNKK